jgi:hypothetical protein
MTWPNGSDYTEAIQNPQDNLNDERLRRGDVVLLPLGIPRVISGNFASVFEVQESGGKWAIKCFTRPVKDLQERYIAISDHLKAHRLSSMVDFEYQLKGILVNGNWYPILRMQWVDGLLLDEFVSRNRNNRQVLLDLASKWIDCVAALRKANIGHGDLQFGNIKVVDSEIKLFDYDGMYVPALRSLGSRERGHPNFQHPKRSDHDFDLFIDNFPAWVIYVSLVAVAEYPAIWAEADGGDDCLIFRKHDFEAPSSSRLFATLERVGSPELRADLARLKDFAQRPPSDFQSLDSVKRPRRDARPPVGLARGTPDWARPIIREKTASKRADEVVDLVRSTGAPELLYSRLVVAAAALLWLLFILGGGLPWLALNVLLIAPSLALMSGIILLVLYEQFSRRVVVAPQDSQRKVASINAELRELESKKQSLRGRLRESNMAIENAVWVRDTFEAQVETNRQEWERRRKDMQRLHEAELLRFDQTASDRGAPAPDLVTRRVKLISDLGSLESQRSADFTRQRRDALKPFVDMYLSAHQVSSASIPGLGEYGINRLSEAGFHTALDILSGRSLQLFGLGHRERVGLVAWAETLREEAKYDAVRHLPSQQADSINVYWNDRRATLERELKALDALIADSEQCHREAFAVERQERLSRFRLALQQHDHTNIEQERNSQRQRLELDRLQQDARRKRTAELMEAAARRSEIDEREKTLESEKKACLVGQELKAVLSFRHFLASLLPKRP